MSGLVQLRDELASCTVCRADGLLFPNARPLFCKPSTTKARVLFVAEAPNHADTFDADKGYLTYDDDTDPTGVFFRELALDVLGLAEDEVLVTNAVLCLPARTKQNNHKPSATLVSKCAPNLRRQMEVVDPLVVVTMGTVPLQAAAKVEDHGLRRMKDAVASPRPWFGRTLFPVYHPGMLARNGPSGRKADEQRRDWRALRDLLDKLMGPSGGSKRPRRRKTDPCVGRWRITGMEAWDLDAIELCGPGYIELGADGSGFLSFIAVTGDIDWQREGDRVDFSWVGEDEGDPVSGRGWFRVDGDAMTGRIYFHAGDNSSFSAAIDRT